MALADSWYLVGPLIAVVGVVAAVLRWALGRDQFPDDAGRAWRVLKRDSSTGT